MLNKKATLLISSLIVLFTVLAIDLKEDINLSSVTEIVFFSVKGHTATNIYLGNKNILIADKELFKNRDKLSFNIEPYWHAFDVTEVNFFDLDSTQTIEIDLIIPISFAGAFSLTKIKIGSVKIAHQTATVKNDNFIALGASAIPKN